MFDKRLFKVSISMYIKWILKQKNPITRRNIQYIFSLATSKDLNYINQSLFASLKTKKIPNLNAKLFLEQIANKSENLEANLNTMFKNIRGSKEYWNKIRSNLRIMNEKLGPATFFLTFSCAEYFWHEFIKFFQKMNPDIPIDKNTDFSELFHLDPICATIFFEKRWQSFLNEIILNKEGPFGEVNNYFYRIEYQVYFKINYIINFNIFNFKIRVAVCHIFI